MAFILLLIQTLVQTVLADKKNMTLFNFKNENDQCAECTFCHFAA